MKDGPAFFIPSRKYVLSADYDPFQTIKVLDHLSIVLRYTIGHDPEWRVTGPVWCVWLSDFSKSSDHANMSRRYL